MTCQLPTSASPQDALKAYLAAKKAMPQLTPAAWRKAAAQEMGLDYDTYLALWKVHKGSAKALKMVPESTPTVPAASSSSSSMGFAESVAKQASEDFVEATKTLKGFKAQVLKGDLDVDDIAESLDDVLHGMQHATANQKMFLKSQVDEIKALKPATSTADEVLEAAKDVVDAIPTPYGPLTHDLAQDAYKQMKKAMPDATPAVWRKAAAQKLGVDYKDYLKAWKKPTSAAQKAKTKPVTGGPVETPLKPTGKYANQDISAEQLKDELARAYGPSANKAYINVVYNDLDGHWSVQFPKSLFPTEAAQKIVVQKLEALGLKVTKGHSGYYNIHTGKSAQTAAKNAAQIKSSGTYTLPDGKVVWDEQSAVRWSDAWWRTLSEAQRKAVKSYTGSGYRRMNSALRGGGTSANVSQLSSAMRKMDHEFTVFRGTNIDINQFVVGGKWQDKGFMSTAIFPGSAWSGVKFEIVIPKGVRGAYVDPHSSARGEKEFILDKGTQFRIIEVDRINNRVKMVAIPH